MRAIKVFMLVFVGAWLVGCTTPGHTGSGQAYDDHKIGMIKKDATTEADLIEWFGPPVSRSMASDGAKVLAWRFSSGHQPGVHAGHLEVRLDPNGKVMIYSAAQ